MSPEDAPDSDEDRQEYYLNVIQRIVDRQKELLGKKAALKWARRAPLHVDKDGNVTDFYGKGEDALETLRDMIENQEFYLMVIQMIVDEFREFLGDKVALMLARKAPLEISPDGDISTYYGTGRNALTILMKQYEDYLGESVAHIKMRNAVQDVAEQELLPGPLQHTEQDERESLFDNIKDTLRHLLPA